MDIFPQQGEAFYNCICVLCFVFLFVFVFSFCIWSFVRALGVVLWTFSHSRERLAPTDLTECPV